MSTTETTGATTSKKGFLTILVIACFLVAIVVGVGVAFLLTNIIERKTEARHTFNWLVPVSDETTDSSEWGKTFPSQFNGYKRTEEATRTRFGGHGGSDAMPDEKIEKDPWLKRLFAGYAFSIDYRDRRGHAYMLSDQEATKRVTERKQPGACLHCHASVMPAYRFAGDGDVMKGFEKVCAMPYAEAHDLKNEKGEKLVQHPVGCVDCHDPRTMQLRVTRPGFINGIQAFSDSGQEAPQLTSINQYRAKKKSNPELKYDVNAMATRAEMRSFVCGQCHVEYYFKGEGKVVTYPWHQGLKVEDAEAYYNETGFSDWTHKETGAKVLKAQHPEFELWMQGVHSRSGVSCADCHMPYTREGALKVSDHWVRSPLLNVNRACQTCHHFSEEEMKARVDVIQTRNYQLMQRAAKAMTEMLDAIKTAKETGATDEQLVAAFEKQRKGQWRLDYVAAENSMGFHAPQEAARILGEACDYFRQGQLEALKLTKQ
jgi:nitrite reductase (cytochrome c-552)